MVRNPAVKVQSQIPAVSDIVFYLIFQFPFRIDIVKVSIYEKVILYERFGRVIFSQCNAPFDENTFIFGFFIQFLQQEVNGSTQVA